ncbi:MAG TPA: TonB-dependent receptor, partial [Acidobacteriaceae bacterium]|nr:TonB-dependent receptor [Acidobacteriaceae bacterium]
MGLLQLARWVLQVCLVSALLSSLGIVDSAYASSVGSISGTVKDPSGAIVVNAVVVATNIDTGVNRTGKTNNSGSYAIADLPIGRYSVDISASGFKSYRRTNVVLDVNDALLVDTVLEIGQSSTVVTVNALPNLVETANTQLGQVLRTNEILSMPLNGRSYTDLLALQPGVVPQTTITSLTVQGLGQSVFSPSGDLNPGILSIQGQRESANGFTVNGADAEETGSMAAAIIPNLDSIAEFRILSSNFDAEYGRYTGGLINVVTKSGTNDFHGDVFEFLRNTDLDARNYFSPTRGKFNQNQFGGTLGGPIVRDKIFFFTDYQGTRLVQGTDTGLIPVPSLADRTGNLMDTANLLTGTVSGPSWASMLTAKLGYPVTVGESYYKPGCAGPTQCVLPYAVIPQKAWSAPAVNLLKYIPTPNAGASTFATSAYNEVLDDNKLGQRLDFIKPWGAIFGYYSWDNYTETNPYPTAQGGANVPGFNGLNTGQAQLIVVGVTKIFGSSAVNEFRFSYTRDANDLGQPSGGLGVSLASQGFVTGEGTLGIVPLSPQTQGVENIIFNNFTIGSVPDRFYQINNNFEVSDGYSKIVGTHALKFGGQVDYDQINTYPFADLNGSFNFYGTETGLDFADFLLGISSQYTQNQLRPFYGRNKYVGLYGQDTWRIRQNLTLNYGLRWDRIEPWYEKYNNAITLIPGEQSVVFPTAPTGIVYPGDPGIPRTLGPPGNLNFAPRIGLAFSPDASENTFLGKLLGGAGSTSIRAGFGIFYSVIPGETLGLISDNAPYGFTYTSPAPPLFATPFIDAATGNIEGQRFPAKLAPLNVSASNPDPNIDFSQFEPIGAIPGYRSTNTTPYTESYMLSLQRQLGTDMVATISYVGNQAHRLLVLEAANPGNPALCLSVSQPSEVAPGSPTCGPFGENGVYTTASGTVINGTRGPLGPAFGSVSYQATVGNSNYNALEISVQRVRGPLQILFSYTYSKAIDQASNFA